MDSSQQQQQMSVVEVEETLVEVLREQDLVRFQEKLAFDKQLTRLEHFLHVTDDELMSYGLSAPSVRRLRAAIGEKRRKQAKGQRQRVVQLQRTVPTSQSSEGSAGNNSTAIPTSTSTSPCLISRNEVKLLETLGEGTFAVVKRAMWRRTNTPPLECAVKILHHATMSTGEVRKDIQAEIANMQRLNHPNLVRLFGVVFGGEDSLEPTLMVLELCANGALLDRLRSQPRLLVTRLLNYTQQISNGMSYLESKRCVHRDLAARNVLLTDNEEVVKICDLGLARSLQENQRLYVMSESKKVPFSWCPPESLRYRQFSHKSDVWAFGVTMWELFTYGEEPWIGCRATDVLRLTEAGERLRRPEYASPEIADLMTMCWSADPEQRPKFGQIRKLLHDIKFTTVIGRDSRQVEPLTAVSAGDKPLRLEMNEQIALIAERSDYVWFGQSLRTREFGVFHRSAVSVQSSSRWAPRPTSDSNNSSQQRTTHNVVSSNLGTLHTYGQSPKHRREVSYPVPGSLIHTGHGDTDENKSWGRVDAIDEIYLRNPVVVPVADVELASNGVTFINSLKELHGQSHRSTSHLPPPSLSPIVGQDNGREVPLASMRRASAEELSRIFGASDAVSSSSTPSIQGPPTQATRRPLSQQPGQLLYPSSYAGKEAAAISARENPSKACPSLEELCRQKQAFSWLDAELKDKTRYDASISIPRPNRSSPLAPTLSGREAPPESRLTPPPPVPTPTSHIIEPHPGVSKSTPAPAASPEQSMAFPSDPRPSSSDNDAKATASESAMIEDPFVVNQEVKTLAQSTRYNEVMQKMLSSSLISGVGLSTPPNVAVVAPLPNNSTVQWSKFEEESGARKLSVESVNSLLPPPSELLLSGIATVTMRPTTTVNPVATDQLQPIFSITHQYRQPGATSRMSYGENGIPILEPLPAHVTLHHVDGHTSKPERCQTAVNPHVEVDLLDLDMDALVEKVRRATPFTRNFSKDQCRNALRKHAYDVENAIRELKVVKLIEMDLCADRQLASSALDYCKWELDAAVNRLLGS